MKSLNLFVNIFNRYFLPQSRPLLFIVESVEKGVEGSLMPDGSCPRKKLIEQLGGR